VLENVDNLIF